MAPEIISAIQTVPPSANTGFSRINAAESQRALQNLRQAQQERQAAAQRTQAAQTDEQQAQKNLQAAQAQEQRAAEQVRAAKTEHQQASRPTPPQTSGKIINVLI
ncbi:MAG: hypothetical protein A2512_05705 [Deltaproteobacteria bacterium RIFOXYD12_FULL_56_24]|nr:MAG: hypothetical protein A2512_05705 [Deltaproteobacteria bacterium RIFOXYD12_FULL_56_24]